MGTARFVDAHTIETESGRRIVGDVIVLCTGGRSRTLPTPGFELTATHSDAWSLTSVPASLLVIGAGATGVQVASVFRAFGSRVQLFEAAPRILATEDEDVSAEMAAALRARGIEVYEDFGRLERFEKVPAGVRMVFSRAGVEDSEEASVVVVAIGWVADTAGLDLAAAGVETDARGYVAVDAHLRTSAAHVFAAGDATGRQMLVPQAAHDGYLAATNAVRGTSTSFGDRVHPMGSFTDPEYAHVGLTEAAARRDRDVVVATVRFASTPRPIIDANTTGLCKLIVDRGSRTLLGCHIVGERAVEIAQVAAVAIASGMTVEAFAQIPLSFPTYTNVLGRAVIQVAQQLDPDGIWWADNALAGAVGPLWDAAACLTLQTVLGEGVRWDARYNELLRVDLLDGLVFRDRLNNSGELVHVRTYHVPGTVGALAPVHGDDGWVLAAGQGFAYLRPDGDLRLLSEVVPAGARMNDAACDPQGRFWAGTTADDHHAGGGALYRMDGTGRTEEVLSGLSISNGLGWSPDGTTMYLVDSGPRVIYAFDFDQDRGAISGKRVLVTVPEEMGTPDGMTVDAAGDLWVAMYGGCRINRYSPDGALRQTLPIPAEQCTCCAFAGPELKWLYVTTATEYWSEEQRRLEPTAGVVYRLPTDATGRPAEPFRPNPDWWRGVTG
jgi:pyruvate/2-oxoglutarate dehydrogenase complex dihydrolipoamide dehydrogenase (E3) component/sugar lactone lactonase YvrE